MIESNCASDVWCENEKYKCITTKSQAFTENSNSFHVGEREKRGDTIYEVRGEITLVFSLLMEHDVKNVLSAVSLTAISQQPRETGGSLEE